MDGKKKEMLKIFITFCATADAKLWTSGSDDGLDLIFVDAAFLFAIFFGFNGMGWYYFFF